MMKTCTWEEEDVTHQVEDLGDSSQHTWQEDDEDLHLGGGRHHTSSGGLGRQLTTHLVMEVRNLVNLFLKLSRIGV